MSKPILIALSSVCALALAAIIILVATTPAPPAPVVQKPEAPVPAETPSPQAMAPVAYEADPLPAPKPAASDRDQQQSASGSVYSQSSDSQVERDRVTNIIFDAVATQSAAGVPTIKPMLQSPDPEVRAAAIEGMRQLAVPEAAAALREVAQRSTTRPEDREEMLDAIEFINLPFVLDAQNTRR